MMAVTCLKCGRVVRDGGTLPLMTVCIDCRRRERTQWLWITLVANCLLWGGIGLFAIWCLRRMGML